MQRKSGRKRERERERRIQEAMKKEKFQMYHSHIGKLGKKMILKLPQDTLKNIAICIGVSTEGGNNCSLESNIYLLFSRSLHFLPFSLHTWIRHSQHLLNLHNSYALRSPDFEALAHFFLDLEELFLLDLPCTIQHVEEKRDSDGSC